MRLVVDANIVIAALIRDGPTRELILDRDLDLRSPSWLWDEIAARRDLLREKTHLPDRALDVLEAVLQASIQTIPDAAIVAHIPAAMDLADPSDVAYAAAVLAIDGTLWTHDQALIDTATYPTITTAGLLRRLEEGGA